MTTFFDAKAYGATGDGRTDDTQALQAAIDAAAVACGTVRLGPGIYRVSAPSGGEGECLSLKGGVTLAGAGADRTSITLLASGPGTAAMVRGAGDNIALSGLTLDANHAAVSGYVNGVSDRVTLSGVAAINASAYGFDLRSDGSHVHVRDAQALHNGANGFIAEGLVASVFEDNLAQFNGADGYHLAGQIRLLDSAAAYNGQDGVYLGQGPKGAAMASALSVDGGAFAFNGLAGVHLESIAGYQVKGVHSYSNLHQGIYAFATQAGQITYNQVYSNNNATPGSEIELGGFSYLPQLTSQDNLVQHNAVTGLHSFGAAYGIREDSIADARNTVIDNVISQVEETLYQQGPDSLFVRNQPFVKTFGTQDTDALAGSVARDQLFGGAGDDRLGGRENSDVLVGGAGRDRLTGGFEGDVFRFDALTDSYRTATVAHTDLLVDFTSYEDRLDLTALGISGFGDGHHGTLKAYYNAAQNVTYLKNFDADDQGRRFELQLSGDQSRLSNPAVFIQAISGTSGADTLKGGDADERLFGGQGADALNGGSGEDRLFGDGAGDRLAGGQGADTFVYRAMSDSLRDTLAGFGNRDLITDFDLQGTDTIDVSALGFTGLGDGHGTTLLLEQDIARRSTLLRALDTDAQGRAFEIEIADNLLAVLSGPASLIFAKPEDAPVTSAYASQDQLLTGTSSADVLTGGSGNDRLSAGAGNDRLNGAVGDDVLTGGRGADRLTGGSGADSFRFTRLADSQRSGSESAVDTVLDFTADKDQIDIRGLGFTGLGDGHNGSLKLTYRADMGATYLQDLDPDAQGARFELKLLGDYSLALDDTSVLFREP
jgi:Ca2+-binding RTX toxin-like protein